VDDVARIKAIVKSIFDAFIAHDTTAGDRLYTRDATVWDVFEPQLFRGPEDRAKFRKADQAQMQKRGKLTLTTEDPVVSVWSDAAIARYYLKFKYEPPNATEGHVRITDVLRKVDGTWLIVHHHEGMVPQGIPPIHE